MSRDSQNEEENKRDGAKSTSSCWRSWRFIASCNFCCDCSPLLRMYHKLLIDYWCEWGASEGRLRVHAMGGILEQRRWSSGRL